MSPNLNRVARKVLLLLFALGVMAAASGVTRPAMACDPEYCLWDPPMHWDSHLCQCVCDCPDLWGNCGPCN
jgi:hypothetical protein